MIREPEVDIDAAFKDGTLIDEAMNQGVRQAIERHRRAGVPMAIWRNGRVEYVSADELSGELNVNAEPAIPLGPIDPDRA